MIREEVKTSKGEISIEIPCTVQLDHLFLFHSI